MDHARRWMAGFGLLAVWGLAVALRWQALDQVTVGSDTLGQFLHAFAAQLGHWPPPPNPEAGPSLWWAAWPIVHLSDGLGQAFALRLAMGALAAPLAMAAVRAAGADWVWATTAGVVIAFDPGLRETLATGFRGYGAPEWLALATLAGVWALRGKGWALSIAVVALVAASGQHPMATGATLGAVLLLPFLVRRVGARACLIAVGLGILVALPRALHIWGLASCGAGVGTCLGSVALGSTEADLGAAAFVMRAWHDRVIVELGWPALGIAVALIWPILGQFRRSAAPGGIDPIPPGALLLWALGALIGIVLLALSISSLRPYHLRMAMVPLVVAAAAAPKNTWPLALVWLVSAGWAWRGPLDLPREDMLGRHDAIAQTLSAHPHPLRIDHVWWGGPMHLEPSGVALSMLLSGRPQQGFSLAPGATQILLVNGPPAGAHPPEAEVLRAGPGWAAWRFENRAVARAWLDHQDPPPVQAGGAYDWAKVVWAGQVDLGDTSF